MNINYYHIRFSSRSMTFAVLLLLCSYDLALAQADRKFIRQGNREYEKDKFSESETLYRKALDKNKESADAVFNSGDALYRQKKYEDAGKQFIESHKMNEAADKKSASLYNLGNSLLMADKIQESIEAFKNSLKLKPDNLEAKYNLAYAQDLLKQQQQKQQNKDNEDQNKDKEQDKKEDHNKDQDQQKDDQQEQSGDQKQQQQKDQQQSISKEDAERLLNAIANDEKNVQEKVKLAKAAKARVKTVKNW